MMVKEPFMLCTHLIPLLVLHGGTYLILCVPFSFCCDRGVPPFKGGLITNAGNLHILHLYCVCVQREP